MSKFQIREYHLTLWTTASGILKKKTYKDIMSDCILPEITKADTFGQSSIAYEGDNEADAFGYFNRHCNCTEIETHVEYTYVLTFMMLRDGVAVCDPDHLCINEFFFHNSHGADEMIRQLDVMTPVDTQYIIRRVKFEITRDVSQIKDHFKFKTVPAIFDEIHGFAMKLFRDGEDIVTHIYFVQEDEAYSNFQNYIKFSNENGKTVIEYDQLLDRFGQYVSYYPDDPYKMKYRHDHVPDTWIWFGEDSRSVLTASVSDAWIWFGDIMPRRVYERQTRINALKEAGAWTK